MADPFLKRVDAKTLRNYARNMAADTHGNSLSDQKMKEVLQKSDKLKHMAYRKTSVSPHEAKRFLHEFTKEIGKKDTPITFSAYAKKMRLDKRSEISDVSDFKIERAYRTFEKKELQRMDDAKPTGPTPDEVRRQKRIEEMRKKMNVYDVQKERKKEHEKQGVQDLTGEKAQGSAADLEKKQGDNKAGNTPKPTSHGSSMRMPSMAGGVRSGGGQRRIDPFAQVIQEQITEEQALFPDRKKTALPDDPTASDRADTPVSEDTKDGSDTPAKDEKQAADTPPSEPSDGGLFAD